MTLAETLETIRTEAGLPALAVCAVIDGRPTETVAVGFRKLGGTDPVLPTDAFQLGSDTKAMTATLIGMLIDDGKLRWTTGLGELFDFVPAPWKAVTISDLIYQTSGLSEDLEPKGTDFNDLYKLKSTERALWLKARLKDVPGKREFVYSNANYAALGLVCERVAGKSWEALIQERLWKPLGILGGGFGGPPKVWQHRLDKKKKTLVPVDPKWNADNPAIMAPAGAAWLPLGEWARFAALHATGTPALLKPETLEKLHTAPTGDYAGAWIVVKGQPWAGGDALTHTGSNTMNMAVAWVAPKKRLAVLAATNAAPESASKALNDAVLAVLRTYLRR